VLQGDGGLDGLIRLDPLGLDVVYVQAKRYTDHHVGRPDIKAQAREAPPRTWAFA
jgi:restriction system protein